MAALVPCLDVEQQLWAAGIVRVAGVDEVGRGCLSGPVVAAAVILPVGCAMLPGVRDSKTLSATQRARLYHAIRAQALAVAVSAAPVSEIDTVNILRATHFAMLRALALVAPYDHALIDGSPVKTVDLGPHTALVDGDATCYAIACASIIAKVVRDRLMRRLALRYPGYGWERNAGYGTAEHLDALRRLGVTPHHRRSFAPVRAILDGLPVQATLL
ncbi:MAG: Ribonuclease HII [Ktedonobacterales bacterium]|jgi:ribonuclease HII|nr:MAG: Ribonuclease HII [Ktedonobacterales bacterium]